MTSVTSVTSGTSGTSGTPVTRDTPASDATSGAPGVESESRSSGGAAQVRRTVVVVYDRNFLTFRSNFARGLSRWMMAERAADLAMDPLVRELHNLSLMDPNCTNCSREGYLFEEGSVLHIPVILHYQQEPVRRVQSFEINPN